MIKLKKQRAFSFSVFRVKYYYAVYAALFMYMDEERNPSIGDEDYKE